MNTLERAVFETNLVRSFAQGGWAVTGLPVLRASISRNKREGKYIGHLYRKAYRAKQIGRAGYALQFNRVPSSAAVRVHVFY